MIASVIMAFPDHVHLLFYSSYSVTLTCIIGRNYGISRSTLGVLVILICDDILKHCYVP